MLPFQREREEMVWLGGVRGEKLYHRAKSPQYNRENALLGGSKKGDFRGTPQKDRLAECPESHFSGVFGSQTRLRFCRKKVQKLFPVTVIFYSTPPTGPVFRGCKC
jgi:hypothetical protein